MEAGRCVVGDNLSWNTQNEGRFRTNAFLGSKSGSSFKISPRRVDATCTLRLLSVLS